jgi:hypothetical protein
MFFAVLAAGLMIGATAADIASARDAQTDTTHTTRASRPVANRAPADHRTGAATRDRQRATARDMSTCVQRCTGLSSYNHSLCMAQCLSERHRALVRHR